VLSPDGTPRANVLLTTQFSHKPFGGRSRSLANLDTISDTKGRFCLRLPSIPPGQSVPVLVMDESLRFGKLLSFDDKSPNSDLIIKLEECVAVTGIVQFKNLPLIDGLVDTVSCNVRLSNDWLIAAFHFRSNDSLPGQQGNHVRSADISFSLPPGTYKVSVGNRVALARAIDLQLLSGQKDCDLGELVLVASPVGKHMGLLPPEVCVTDAIGIRQVRPLETLRGEWVIVEFWSYTCSPCVSRSLPTLREYYRRHKGQEYSSSIEIVAIHSARGIRTKAELEERLFPIKERAWKGEALPFPILIDGEGCTADHWGIKKFPTTILLDPQGRIRYTGSISSILALLDRELKRGRQVRSETNIGGAGRPEGE